MGDTTNNEFPSIRFSIFIMRNKEMKKMLLYDNYKTLISLKSVSNV